MLYTLILVKSNDYYRVLTNPESIRDDEKIVTHGSFETLLLRIKELDIPTEDKNELLEELLDEACSIVGHFSEKIIKTAHKELGRDDYKQYLIEMYIL